MVTHYNLFDLVIWAYFLSGSTSAAALNIPDSKSRNARGRKYLKDLAFLHRSAERNAANRIIKIRARADILRFMNKPIISIIIQKR